jgi:hypothetical protein
MGSYTRISRLAGLSQGKSERIAILFTSALRLLAVPVAAGVACPAATGNMRRSAISTAIRNPTPAIRFLILIPWYEIAGGGAIPSILDNLAVPE